jgi:hypothetical protein
MPEVRFNDSRKPDQAMSVFTKVHFCEDLTDVRVSLTEGGFTGNYALTIHDRHKQGSVTFTGTASEIRAILDRALATLPYQATVGA